MMGLSWSTLNNMEKVKRCEVVFWITFTAASVLLILGERYSSPGTAEPGYSASDTFSSVGYLAVWLMAISARNAIVSLKQEITELKSGEADVPGDTQDSE